MAKSRLTVVALLAIGLLTSCSRTKTISPDELRSDMLSAISLAAETELFVGQVQQHRATESFERGHLEYLRQRVADELQQLRNARAASSLAPRLETCRSQLDALAAELASLKKNPTDSDRLSAARQRTAQIRTALERAQNSR